MSTVSLFYSIEHNLFQFGGPILAGVGTISCILNLLVFTKSSLRKNPCAICLIAVNISNFLFIYFGLLFTILATGYNIDPSSYNIFCCRFRFYIATVLPCYESSCLILASIDRTLLTSSNATTRQRSTRRATIISIISICLFWTVFHVHAWIFTQILEYGPNYFVCFNQPGAYTVFITYYSLTINGILPPALMTIFGCWTVKNIRQARRIGQRLTAVHTGIIAVGRSHILQSKDQQLIRMLLVDTITYVICKSPLIILYIYEQITQYTEKSAEQLAIEQAILQITYFLFFTESCIGCYTNILVSKTFRKELKRILTNTRL
ncbi:unnamed protein product [Adineta steineri]|uniref:G-protein coupled receptors family 1 profile domain-containing protein n=1 Tax=Adineta steineri TaxID=433720 RepID=A0A813WFD4_9BILA|nr:unnamed protein product [Adineta steineri]